MDETKKSTTELIEALQNMSIENQLILYGVIKGINIQEQLNDKQIEKKSA